MSEPCQHGAPAIHRRAIATRLAGGVPEAEKIREAVGQASFLLSFGGAFDEALASNESLLGDARGCQGVAFG